MVARNPNVPGRGDVVWINFNPQSGHEQAGRRPALVLSPRIYNERAGLAIVCPITNRKKGYPFEVDIPYGYSVTGVILSDQVKNVDWQSRNTTVVGRLPTEIISKTLEMLDILLYAPEP